MAEVTFFIALLIWYLSMFTVPLYCPRYRFTLGSPTQWKRSGVGRSHIPHSSTVLDNRFAWVSIATAQLPSPRPPLHATNPAGECEHAMVDNRNDNHLTSGRHFQRPNTSCPRLVFKLRMILSHDGGVQINVNTIHVALLIPIIGHVFVSLTC